MNIEPIRRRFKALGISVLAGLGAVTLVAGLFLTLDNGMPDMTADRIALGLLLGIIAYVIVGDGDG